MSAFDLEASFERAERLLRGRAEEGARRRRSDRGAFRLPPEVIGEIRRLASGHERPSMSELRTEVARFCASRRLRQPSRAALYRILDSIPGRSYDMASLPDEVKGTLHNVEPTAPIPGAQLAFHCFNYGSVRALSYASGLPWLDLYQARKKRGWRQKSRGVLDAVCRARGI